jgi:hypothetical protein
MYDFLLFPLFKTSNGTVKFSITVCLETFPKIRNSFGGGTNLEGTNFHPEIKQKLSN